MKELITKHSARLRYLIVGGWNTIFGYALFVALHWLLGTRVHYLLILLIVQIISILNAYVAYKHFVFKTRGNVMVEFVRFNVIYVALFVFNMIALPFFVEVLKLSTTVSQGIIVSIAAGLGYLGHKTISFAKR